jgi:flagellar basal body-associated protein FliL
MATAEKKAPEAAPAVDSSQSKPRSSLMGKLLLLFFMGAVIGGECIAAYLLTSAYRPSGVAIAATPLKEPAGKAKPAKETEDAAEKNQTEELEVDLGKFDVNSYQPKANTTSIIDFHLYATVASSDKSAFNASIDQNKNRLRDQILVIVRSADLAELTEPGLGLLKRRILEKSNTILGKAFLRTIVFGDFSFTEQ